MNTEQLTEVIKGNKLIAEFMGWEKSPYPNTPHKMYKGDNGVHIDNLEYHSSWDWLMPVCIKLGMESVSTDINKTYNDVITRIGAMAAH